MLLFGTRSAIALDWTTDLSLGPEWLQGHTTYEVDGLYNYSSGPPFVSELKFPLNAWYLSGRGVFTLNDRFSLSIAAKKNITGDPGNMEDTDVIYPGATPDIYSESDAELDALILEEKLRYRFYETPLSSNNQKWSFFAGLGYRYQYFDFEVGNTLQYYPSSGHSPDFYAGPTLEYTVEYFIPYLEMAGFFQVTGKATVALSFGYAPTVIVLDEDYHLLRNRYSEGDCYGRALLLSGDVAYHITQHWSSRLELSHLAVKATGASETYQGGVFHHALDQEIRSSQTSAKIQVSYQF